MNNSGDAAEQVVRITIDGIEVAAKITGAAVKILRQCSIPYTKQRYFKGKLKGQGKIKFHA